MLCAAALLVSVAASSPIMVSAVPMLTMLVGASLLVSPAARSALRSVRLADAIAAVALLFATASPSIIAYLQQHDQIVSTLVGSCYSFGGSRRGTPSSSCSQRSGSPAEGLYIQALRSLRSGVRSLAW